MQPRKGLFNVDETRLYYKEMLDKTYIGKEKAMPDFKAVKDRLTMLLGVNASGNLLLFYHSKNLQVLKNISKNLPPVVQKTNKFGSSHLCRLVLLPFLPRNGKGIAVRRILPSRFSSF